MNKLSQCLTELLAENTEVAESTLLAILLHSLERYIIITHKGVDRQVIADSIQAIIQELVNENVKKCKLVTTNPIDK